MFIRIFPRYGLSPLARGTLTTRLPVVSSMRFIPAGAGNTSGLSLRIMQSPVYPRWRGEHLARPRTNNTASGLSPLARGTRRQCQATRVAKRFIPAGAGNTSLAVVRAGWDAVYPRWRGEHVFWSIWPEPRFGLSPLARGTRNRTRKSLAGNRFIPAGAGNTSRDRFSVSLVTVYPRWRGEHVD